MNHVEARKFRKRPLTIEAMQWKGLLNSTNEELTSMRNFLNQWNEMMTGGQLIIRTLEGLMTALPGDWIIKGIKGEFYPCKDIIFRETYEAVDD